MSDVMEATEKAPFIVDLNKWRMGDFRAFINAVREEAWEDAYPLISRVIVSWPFEGDPSQGEVIANLGLLDLATTLRAVNLAVTQAFTQGN